MSLAPGTRLGPYEVREPLGAGGMGEVYRARDARLSRDVAVKVLPEDLADDPKTLVRFEAEARAVAALSHPNILAIFDFGEADGVRYAVTELLQGETLEVRLSRGAAPPRKVVEWGLQVARGLAAAHERHIVHRDVKPANLFLTEDGIVKILDFGLAKSRRALAGGPERETIPFRTEAGMVVGTAWYMSPEQVRAQEVDGRSDLFSLGSVLFELLAGKRPFDAGSAAEAMAAIARDEPRELPATVPAGLARVVLHCLEKEPSARFQSARDLAFALETLSGGFDSRTAPASLAAVPRERMSAKTLFLCAGAVLAVAAAGAAGFWLRGRPRPAVRTGPVPVSFSQVTDFPGVERRPTLSPDGKTVVYVASARGNDDLFALRVGGRKPVNLTEDSDVNDGAPAFSPDGRRIAFRSERSGGGVFVMEATGESVRRVTEFGHDPAWAPDGTRLAIATEAVRDPMSRAAVSELWIAPLEGGAPQRIAVGDAVGPSWSPSGRRIAYWASRQPSRHRDVFTVSADGRGAPVPVTDDPAVDWAPVFSPDGRSLYFGSNRGGTMNLWRVPIDEESGRVLGPLEPVTTPTSWSGWFCFGKDGRTLVFADLDERANVLRARFDAVAERIDGAPETVLRGRAIVSIDFSPGADWLAFSQRVQPWEAIGVVRADGRGYAALTDSTHYHRIPRWSPDGSRIVFYSNRDGKVGFYTIRPDGSALTRLGAVTDERLYPTWSPDGTRLAAATFAGGGLAFLDPGPPGSAADTRLLSEALRGSVLLPMSWSADGKRIAAMARGTGIATGPVQGVFVYELPDGPLREIDPAGVSPEWLPDSRRLLFSRQGGVVLVDTQTGRRRDVLPKAGLPGSWGRELAVSGDGKWLAWIESLGEGDIWLMTLSGAPEGGAR